MGYLINISFIGYIFNNIFNVKSRDQNPSTRYLPTDPSKAYRGTFTSNFNRTLQTTKTQVASMKKMISLFRTEDGIKMNIFDLSKDVYYMEIIGKKYILHLIY